MSIDSRISPRFSVIIPTYNRAEFVTRAIDSILGQSYKSREILVIDDGSTDRTSEALGPYGASIKVIHQANAGVSAARNAGIREAKGDWIVFLDSDDEWRPDYLLQQARRIETQPDAIAHITNAVTIHPDGRTDNHFQPHLLRKFGSADYIVLKRPLCTIVGHSHWYLQSTTIRADILLAAGLFNPKLTIAEDLDLIARVSLQGPFGISRNILVETYRRCEAIKNLALQREEERVRTYQMFEGVYDGLRRTGALNRAEKIALSRALSSNRRAMGNVFLREGNLTLARESYRKAMMHYPSARSAVKYIGSFLPHKAAGLLVRK